MKRTFFQKVNRGVVLLIAFVLLTVGVMICKKAEMNKRIDYDFDNAEQIMKNENRGGFEYDYCQASYVSYNRIVITAVGFSAKNTDRDTYDVSDTYYFEKKAGKWNLIFAGDYDPERQFGFGYGEDIWYRY